MSDLADRIFELIDPWDRWDDDPEKMKKDIDETIKDDPKAIISDLLDRLENMI